MTSDNCVSATIV